MVTLKRVTGLAVLVDLIAVVVVVSGVVKVRSPRPFADLTATVGVPGGTVGARFAGLLEIALGVWVLATGARIACAVLALAYVTFAVVVVAARRAGAPSCGCFGATAAPPSVVHVVVNLVSAAVAATAALAGDVDGIAATLSDQPMAGVPFLLLLGTGAWLLVSLDTVGATVVDATRELTTMGPVFRENAVAPSPSRSTTTARPTISPAGLQQHGIRSDSTQSHSAHSDAGHLHDR